MIKINNAILHILGSNSDMIIFSEQELDVLDENTSVFLSKHIEKSLSDSNIKSGVFLENSSFIKKLNRYLNTDLEFIELSKQLANEFYSMAVKSGKSESLDFIVCDFQVDIERFIGILNFINRIGYTHKVTNNDNKIKNEIINHYAILPNPSQKTDEYAFVNITNSKVKFNCLKRYIDGKDIFIIPDVLLQCSSSISQKDAIQLVTSITNIVADKHGKNTAMAVSKAKRYIVQSTELSDYIEPAELGKEVFNYSEEMQEDFIKEIQNSGVPETISVDKKIISRTGKNHKIKTDTGIEISFPVDYFQNKDFIEFINNPDGTLSIELKNIGKLINK